MLRHGETVRLACSAAGAVAEVGGLRRVDHPAALGLLPPLGVFLQVGRSFTLNR